MSNRRRILTVAGMSFAAIVTTNLALQAEDRRASDNEIESLIEELASPDKEPRRSGATGLYFADTYARTRAMGPWGKLSDAGTRAFPYLLKHAKDERYSFLWRDDRLRWREEKWTVGRACLGIVRGHLQPFGFDLRVMQLTDTAHERRPSYIRHHKLNDPDAAAKWWEARKDKTLLELQIEVLEWTISHEAKYRTLYHDDERAYLNGFLETARKAEGPLPPSSPFD